MRTTLIVAMLLAVGSGSGRAPPERAEWWSVEKSVVDTLLARDAGQWARELNTQPLPATAGELMSRYSVFYRAGHLRQLRQVIDAISDANVEVSQLSSMADSLIGRKDWSTARYFLERIPQAQPGWGYVLIKEWAGTGNANEIDAWLVERAKSNPYYWLQERLRFRSDQGTAGELIEEMARKVRQRPHDAEVALQFLQTTAVVRKGPDDIAWIGELSRPPSAYSSYRVGMALRGAPRATIALLDHSLEMPFTKEDAAALQATMSHSAVARPVPQPQELEQQLRYTTKRELLNALHAAGESARAQKLLEELAAMQIDGLPPSGLDGLAGQVQAASGARVVQQRFQEAEAENQNSAQYWQRRAWYFTGRKEYSDAIAAYEKAMQLSVPDPDDITARNSGVERRSSVLPSYVSVLISSDRHEAVKLLLERELRDAPPEGNYAQRIVDIVVSNSRSTLFAVDRERLWAYLAARPQWNRTEERLLWRLVELAQPPDQLQKIWPRAEELARDRDPSRSLVLAWVMTRCNDSSRAIPWLKSAWQRLEKPDEQQKAAFNLFEAYLDVGDWRSAEEVWPTARQQLTPTEIPDWLGRIAVAAARAREPAEAMRIWKQRTNLERASTGHLEEMLSAGMREPLVAFYRSLAEGDPDCQSIQEVVRQHFEARTQK